MNRAAYEESNRRLRGDLHARAFHSASYEPRKTPALLRRGRRSKSQMQWSSAKGGGPAHQGRERRRSRERKRRKKAGIGACERCRNENFCYRRVAFSANQLTCACVTTIIVAQDWSGCIHFERLPLRPKLIEYGPNGSWDDTMISACPNWINETALNVASSKSRRNDHDCKRSRTKRHS